MTRVRAQYGTRVRAQNGTRVRAQSGTRVRAQETPCWNRHRNTLFPTSELWGVRIPPGTSLPLAQHGVGGWVGSREGAGQNSSTQQVDYSAFVCVCVCVCVCVLLSRVRLFVTPCSVARQGPLSMEFSRQEHWSGLSFPLPADFLDPGIDPWSPELAGRCFTF